MIILAVGQMLFSPAPNYIKNGLTFLGIETVEKM